MKKQFLLGAAVAVTVLMSACSQGPAEVAGGLEAQFGTPLYDRASGTVTDTARNRVYVNGIEASAKFETGQEDVFLRRYDTAGKLIWNLKLARTTGQYWTSVSVTDPKLDAAGNIYQAYTRGYEGSYELPVVLLKVSPAGKVLYRAELISGCSVNDLDVDASGNVYVSLCSDESYYYTRVFLRKYSPDGAQMWERKTLYDEGTPISSAQNIPAPAELNVAPNGTLYVTSQANDVGGPVLTRYSSSTGRTLGQTPMPRAVYRAAALSVSPDAVYTSFLKSSAYNYRDYVVQKRDLSGAVLWERAVRHEIYALATDRGSNVYLAGQSGSNSNLAARKYTSGGTLAWTYTNGDLEGGSGIAAANDGSTYLAGGRYVGVTPDGGNNYDAYLVKLGVNGRSIWFR